MSRKNKKSRETLINKLFPILIFIITIFMGVGYASINSVLLNVSGDAIAKAQDGIFITSVEYVERDGALPSESADINLANGTLLNSSITLEENNINSEVSLKVNFYNSYKYDYAFKDVVYDEDLIDEMEDTYSNLNITYTFNNVDEIISGDGVY